MKKVLLIALCLVVCLGMLFGCGGSGGGTKEDNPYELYKTASEAMKDIQSIEMDIEGTIDTTMEEFLVSSTLSGNVKQVFKSDSDVEMQLSLNINTMGMDIKMDGYYTQGVYYTDILGMKFKESMDIKEAMAQGNTSVIEFDEDAVKESKIEDVEGGKKVSFTLNIAAVFDSISSNTSDMLEGVDVNELNAEKSIAKCELIVGEDNMIKEYHIAFDFVTNGDNQQIKYDMTMKVKSINDVTIQPPSDLDEYVESEV